MLKLSIVIPAYKEEHRIGKTLQIISDYLSRQQYEAEVLVVVDGSPDKTAEVAEKYKASIKNLQVINNTLNHGKGWVVRQGMLKAVGDYRLFTDADNSTSIDQIEKFWPLSGEYKIIIGSIEVPGAKVNEHAQWYRRWVGHIVKYIIRLGTGLWDIRDTQRGFKLFSAKAAKDVFSKATIDRFGFDFEVLAIAKQLKYKIKEVPVVWENAGGSTVSLGSYFSTLWDLLIVRRNLTIGKYK